MIKLFILLGGLAVLQIANLNIIKAIDNVSTSPMSFYGQVTINGLAAPVGTKIRAYYGNLSELAGEITTTIGGVYGEDGPTKAKLVVASGTGAITFAVAEGESFTAGTTALTYPSFTAGETVNLNLAFQTSIGCTEQTWSPAPTTVCSGQTFTQTSNCSTVRSGTGTKTCTYGGGGGSSSGSSSSGSVSTGNPSTVSSTSGASLPTGSGTTLATGSGSTTGTSEPVISFSDIDQHWAKNYILRLAQLGVVNGKEDGRFYPDATISRAEYLKLVLRTLRVEITSTAAQEFVDVPADAWYTGYVATAYRQGIVTGKDRTHFAPNDPITRAEALKILFKVLGLKLSAGDTKFNDVPRSAWFNKYVFWGFQYGLVTGRSTTVFAPNDPLTRAEAAKIMVKLLDFKP